MSEHRRRSAPSLSSSRQFQSSPATSASLANSTPPLNLARPASPPRRKGSKPSLPAGAVDSTSRSAALAAAQSSYSHGGTELRKQEFTPPLARQDLHSHETNNSDGYDSLSCGESAVFSEAVERTASAVAAKVCPELSAVVQASLAEQARELVKLLQPLCSELGVVAHRLTVAVQRAEMKSDPGSSSDSSESDLQSRNPAPRSSPHHCRSPRSSKGSCASPSHSLNRQMSPDCDYSTTSTTNGEGDKRTREPRVASAPELPLPTKKSSTHKVIDRPPQSVTLSALPDVRFGSNEGAKNKAKDMRRGPRSASYTGAKYKGGEQIDSPPTQDSSRINSKDVQTGSEPSRNGSKMTKRHDAPGTTRPQREKFAASLIGVSRGAGKTRPSSWQHLSHTTELRFLQDSLASELFKATYLVPGSSPSANAPATSKNKPWMSTVPGHMSPTGKQVGPAGMAGNMFAANGMNYWSNGSSSKELTAMGRPSSPEGKAPCSTHEKLPETAPSSSSESEGGNGEKPDEPLRTDRPSFSAPAHSTLLTLPPLTGEIEESSEKFNSEQDGRQFASEHSDSMGRNRRRRSVSQPPQTRPQGIGNATAFGAAASLATQSAEVDAFACPKTAKEVRQLNEQQLTMTIRNSITQDSVSSEEANAIALLASDAQGAPASENRLLGERITAVLLRVCGVLPWSQRLVWCSALYFWALVLLVVLSIASCLQQVFDTDCSQSRTSLGRLSDTVFAFGALSVLVSCRTFQRELSDCNALLVSYAEKRGFLQHWAQISKRDAMVSLLVWICIILERVRSIVIMPEHDCAKGKLAKGFAILCMVGFLLASGLLLILVHHILYIARCLSSMIDTFCCRFVELPDFTEAVTEWNVLQAVIRKSCETIQYCFFAVQTTTTVAAFLNVVDITRQVEDGYKLQHILGLLPGALIVLVVIRMFICAGAVTDKCARVPSLVNSLSFGSADLDRDRLYVVEYIAHSQAGFYIFEVRLTSATVLKIFYFSCVVALALATRVASDSW